MAGWDFQIDLNLKNIKNIAKITGSARESGTEVPDFLERFSQSTENEGIRKMTGLMKKSQKKRCRWGQAHEGLAEMLGFV